MKRFKFFERGHFDYWELAIYYPRIIRQRKQFSPFSHTDSLNAYGLIANTDWLLARRGGGLGYSLPDSGVWSSA